MINYFSLLLPVVQARAKEIKGSAPEIQPPAVGAGQLVRTRFSPHQHRMARAWLGKIRSELGKEDAPGIPVQGERIEVAS